MAKYAYLYVVFGTLLPGLTGWLLIGEFYLAVSSAVSGWSWAICKVLKSLGPNFRPSINWRVQSGNGTYIDLIAVLGSDIRHLHRVA